MLKLHNFAHKLGYYTALLFNVKMKSKQICNKDTCDVLNNIIWLCCTIQGLKTANRLLLAQTPLPATVDDFLLLALQERCSCIVNMDPEHTKHKVL